MKEYRPWTPRQSFLLPPSPLDWLPPEHPAYFILDVVEQLDLSSLERRIQEKDARGERPYSPRMMTALLLFAYCTGVFSSRRIARATHEDVAFRVICGGEHPHFTTINQFRLDHLDALKALFLDVLKLCRKAGLVRLGVVALDGSKVRANASKHKAMSYERMRQEEKRLQAEIDALLEQARGVDQAENAKLGEEESEDPIPAEFARREARLARIQAARAELEAEAARARAEELRSNAEAQRRKAEDPEIDESERKRSATRAAKAEAAAEEAERKTETGRSDDDDKPSGGSGAENWPHHRVPTEPDGTPAPKAQRNFTDPESRIMVSDGAYIQGYNAQAVVDDAHQIILAAGVSNQAPDQEHLAPMLERVVSNCEEAPKKASADAGYFTVSNVETCDALGTEPYISPGRERKKTDATKPRAPTGSADADARTQMRAKLATKEGHAVYARRKSIVEPVFGQIKEARHFRRFSLRGLLKADAEWHLVCAAHNLLKYYRGAWLQNLAMTTV